jgi:hypothetical protein
MEESVSLLSPPSHRPVKEGIKKKAFRKKDSITEYLAHKYEHYDLCWCETDEHESIFRLIERNNLRVYIMLPTLPFFPPACIVQVPEEILLPALHYFTSGIFTVSRNRNGHSINTVIPFYLRLQSSIFKTDSSCIYKASFSLGHKSYDDVLYLKMSNRRECLKTEFMIGYYGLNDMRRQIPNFVLTYGLVMLKQETYLVLERLTSDMLVASVETFGDLCLYFLQVYLALHMARDATDFSHYDMHRGNVIITRMPELESITYRYGGEDITLTSPFRATLIDFGRSRARIIEKSVSSPDNATNTVNHAKSNLLVDYYRLFMTVAQAVGFVEMQELYGIFGGSNLSKALTTQEEYFFYYDGMNGSGDKVCADVINYLLQNRTIYEGGTPYRPPCTDCVIREPNVDTLLAYLETPKEIRKLTPLNIANIMTDATTYLTHPQLHRLAREFYRRNSVYATDEQTALFEVK